MTTPDDDRVKAIAELEAWVGRLGDLLFKVGPDGRTVRQVIAALGDERERPKLHELWAHIDDARRYMRWIILYLQLSHVTVIAPEDAAAKEWEADRDR